MDIRSAFIKDNGLRSFVPPCFSWDVFELSTGKKITTVSEIDLSALGLTAEDEDSMRYAMMRGEFSVSGRTHETDVYLPSKQRGVVLVVEIAEQRAT